MTEHTHHTYSSQVDFSPDQIQEDLPVTEFRQAPDRKVSFEVFNRDLKFDDGARHEIWGFETPTSGRGIPSPRCVSPRVRSVTR